MSTTKFVRDDIKLIVEEQDGVMSIVHAEMSVQETVFLIGALVEKVAACVGQSVDDTLEDLKQQQESI